MESPDDDFTPWSVNSLDSYLASSTPQNKVRNLVRALWDQDIDIPAGTRVAFDGCLSNLLAYPNPPLDRSIGTVVTVRTATGDATHLDGMVFVKWDDGSFQGAYKDHLRLASTTNRRATLSEFRRVVADLGDLGDFLRVASGPDLVHKATKDLWSLSQVDGEYVIERLFSDSGKPLKV